MRRVLVGATVLALVTPSYVWAAPPEGVIGAPLPTSGRAASPGAALPEGLADAGAAALGGVSGYGQALRGLRPDARAAVRGAKEVEVYRAAAPSVVLVLTDDGFGSGALVSADGQIITNLHVVGDADEVGVIFKPKAEGDHIEDADILVAKVIRRDEVADLALIQVAEAPEGVVPLVVGDVSNIEIGADVHAIGHPTGNSWTYTRGIVSQIRRDAPWDVDDGFSHRSTLIQTQTPINPGNSGGPLLDDDLRIVGVNSFIGEGEGLNFAVSGDDVKAFLARSGDRYAEAPKTPKAPSRRAKACKPTAVDSWPSKGELPGVTYLLDYDCDGEGDVVANVPDDESEAIMYFSDEDGDGRTDTFIFDADRDDLPDAAFYDTDGDGELDLQGFFKEGALTPYRFEVMEPEEPEKPDAP